MESGSSLPTFEQSAINTLTDSGILNPAYFAMK